MVFIVEESERERNPIGRVRKNVRKMQQEKRKEGGGTIKKKAK